MRLNVLLVTSFAFAAAMGGLCAQAAEEEIVTIGAVKLMSGGVGEESETRVLARSGEFNLKLLFATRTGHYLAGIPVTIADAGGKVIAETVSEGPWLLATLAPGKYVITAANDEIKVTRSTTIPASGRREIFYRWDDPE
jgi:hypothetical protein